MLRFKFASVFTILAAAIAITSAPAMAQQTYRGEVELPVETHWGSAVLEPGAYTISIEKMTTGTVYIHVAGHDTTASILAGPAEKSSDRASLTLVNVNGAYRVQKFAAGATGTSYSFLIPKSVQATTASVIPIQ